MSKTIKLADIRIDGGTQSRVAINTDVVTDYANAMREGETLPPLLVFFDGASHWLADGFHRFHASRKVGLAAVEVELVQGTLQDAKLHAYGANKSHGLRRTNEDKRKAVLGMLVDFGAWSDNKIAKHVGVHHSTVADYRSSLADSASDKPTERTFTTKHGTEATMKTGDIGKAKPAAPASKEPLWPAAKPFKPEVDRRDCDPEPYVWEGPSDAELAYLEQAEQEFTSKLQVLLDADDALATATEKWKQAALRCEQLQLRINGLVNENGQLVRDVKYWRNQARKAA